MFYVHALVLPHDWGVDVSVRQALQYNPGTPRGTILQDEPIHLRDIILNCSIPNRARNGLTSYIHYAFAQLRN